jgi:hypothetical protein
LALNWQCKFRLVYFWQQEICTHSYVPFRWSFYQFIIFFCFRNNGFLLHL